MERVSLYERYDELKAMGYDYLMHVDIVRHLVMDMDDLGITGFVDITGGVNTFDGNRFTYEDFMTEILTQGVANIILVKDSENGGRDYYRCNSMFTLEVIEA